VSDDIRGLDQLDKREASFVACAKMFQPWFAIRDHVDLLDKLVVEL